MVNLRTGWFLKGSKNQLEKPVTRARRKSTTVGVAGVVVVQEVVRKVKVPKKKLTRGKRIKLI